jgi:hypothetical protein
MRADRSPTAFTDRRIYTPTVGAGRHTIGATNMYLQWFFFL